MQNLLQTIKPGEYVHKMVDAYEKLLHQLEGGSTIPYLV